MAKKLLSTYQQLLEKSKHIHIYHSILNLLHWDQETCMPPGGIQLRSQQIAQLSHLTHEEKTSPSYKHLLAKLVNLNTGTIKEKNLKKLEELSKNIDPRFTPVQPLVDLAKSGKNFYSK